MHLFWLWVCFDYTICHQYSSNYRTSIFFQPKSFQNYAKNCVPFFLSHYIAKKRNIYSKWKTNLISFSIKRTSKLRLRFAIEIIDCIPSGCKYINDIKTFKTEISTRAFAWKSHLNIKCFAIIIVSKWLFCTPPTDQLSLAASVQTFASSFLFRVAFQVLVSIHSLKLHRSNRECLWFCIVSVFPRKIAQESMEKWQLISEV